MNTTVSAPDATPAPALPGFARWTPLWVLLFVFALPWPGVAEGLLSLGALIGMVCLIALRFRGGTRWLSREAWAVLTVMFLGYWLPEFFSAFDAVNRERAWKEVLVDLRYLPFLWLCAVAVSHRDSRRWVFGGIGVIVLLWCIDAAVQAFLGVGLRGAPEAERLTGIFGAENPKLGPVLAVFAPFLLFLTLRHAPKPVFFLVALGLGVVILLAGARAAWLSYALVLLLCVQQALNLRWMLALTAVLALSSVLAYFLSPALQSRVERSLVVQGMDAAAIDHALSGRLSIWETSLRMAGEHPINGVGIRGFRDAYPQFADGDDWFVAQGDVAFHAHHWVLELLSETGIIGLLCWTISLLVAWRAWRWSPPSARQAAMAPAIALIAIAFPLNTHLAFFSTFWGGLWLLLIALFAGTLGAHDRHDRAS